MSNEELNIIAQMKNSKGVASKEARVAQEIIWERRITIEERYRDDYTGRILEEAL